MRNTDIINNIFSEALNQLESEWSDKDPKVEIAGQVSAQASETEPPSGDASSATAEADIPQISLEQEVDSSAAFNAMQDFFALDNNTAAAADISDSESEVDSAFGAMADFFEQEQEKSESDDSAGVGETEVDSAFGAMADFFQQENDADTVDEKDAALVALEEAFSGEESSSGADSVDCALSAMEDFFSSDFSDDSSGQPSGETGADLLQAAELIAEDDTNVDAAFSTLEDFFGASGLAEVGGGEDGEAAGDGFEGEGAESESDKALDEMTEFFAAQNYSEEALAGAEFTEIEDTAIDAVADFWENAACALPGAGSGNNLSDNNDKENDVAVDKDDLSDFLNSDLPPEDGGFEEDDEDLDSLLNDLANSADVEEEDEDSGVLTEEDDTGFESTDDEDSDFNDLLEGALGLNEIEPDDEEADLSSLGAIEHDVTEDPGFSEDQSSDLDRLLEEASLNNDDSDDDLLPDEDEEGFDEDEDAAADDFSSTGGGLFGADLEDLADDLTGALTDDDDGDMVVRNIAVPEPSIPLSEEADEELERKLAEMGLGGDNLLHNSFSAEKEKLLDHLIQRFELLARRKLEGLPNEQVNMIKSVNLRVEIDLKFGEYIASGNDDSLFSIDI